MAEREQRYFSDFYCARLVAAEMRELHEMGAVKSLAWVVMPDHVHWLFQLGETETLSSVVKPFNARALQRVNHYSHNTVRGLNDVNTLSPVGVISPNSRGLESDNRQTGLTKKAMMDKQLPIQGTQPFGALKQNNGHGAEYWSARDLQPLLGYSQWRRFEQAIERAIMSCKESGNPPANQ